MRDKHNTATFTKRDNKKFYNITLSKSSNKSKNYPKKYSKRLSSIKETLTDSKYNGNKGDTNSFQETVSNWDS